LRTFSSKQFYITNAEKMAVQILYYKYAEWPDFKYKLVWWCDYQQWICVLVVVMGRDFVSALRLVASCTIPRWKRMWPS
jgi:hypothetical protein